MSADELALLAGVRAAPHDDTPRLVYADWLDETGNAPRAEFIRVQCALAAGHLTGRAWVAHHDRETFLWHRYRERFRATFRGNLRGYPFRRGFPDPGIIRMGLDVLLTHPAERFDAVPAWQLILTYWPEQLASLAASPRLLRLSYLELSLMDDAQAGTLAGSPFARNLRSLTCRNATITAAGTRALGASPHLPSLRRLAISTSFALDAVHGLLQTPLIRQLAEIDLTGSRCGASGLALAGRALIAAGFSPDASRLVFTRLTVT